jgi:N-acetylglucosaminyl-diphospho-decaprenol L-rhamnosyltransferase
MTRGYANGSLGTAPTPVAHGDAPARTGVSVVLVSFRTPTLLVACLQELRREASVREVIVVDNASGDESADVVERAFPEVRLIRNPVNIGFAQAVNQALGLCEGQYILLLNPDVVLEETALSQLVALLASDPAIGAAGPAIRHITGRLRVLSGGRQPTLWRMFTHATLLSRFSRRVPLLEGLNLLSGIHDDRPRDVEWLTGACLMLRRDALDSVGPLSERWFMYAEDLELCHRLDGAGWRLVHLPSAQIVHHMAASTDTATATSTAWAVALHDYYRRDISNGPIARMAWRLVFAAQLLSRSLYYRLRARRARMSSDRERTNSWMREARGFAASAIDVLRGTRPVH